MLFPSEVFLWVFLPIVLILYYGVFRRSILLKNIFLLIASLYFYAWGEPEYVFLMLVVIVINYFVGLTIDTFDDSPVLCRVMMILGTVIDLVVLGYYKYSNFAVLQLNRFLHTDIGEIRIFSRDEKKQDDMRHDFQARMPEVANKIKFYIGDVRNKSTLKYAMKGVDYVFHAAALKQVPSCEFFPMEAVKTNVIGTDNTLDAAIDAGVKCVICLSTDKAAYPINAMGITKAIEEKIAVAKSRLSGNTKICCTRYGNVMCSRGSVIPLWIDQIRKGNPITLTEPKMTRFIMSLEEAVDLVLFAFEHGQNGDILVQKAPACTIQTQAEAVCELFGHQWGGGASTGSAAENIKVIGIRHGEKMYETLLTKEECAKAEDMGNFYRVPADNRDLNYDKYFKEGDVKLATIDEFNSDNTRRLNLEETKAKIASLEYIQNELNGIPNIVK